MSKTNPVNLIAAFILIFLTLQYPVYSYCQQTNSLENLQAWLTTPGNNSRLQPVPIDSLTANRAASAITIDVTDATTYQSIDGFGFSFTGGSAIVLNRLSAANRKKILHELFGNGKDEIGISYLRISIGSSDLSDHIFTYDEVAAGERDTLLQHFSLEQESKDLIPVLKEIISINPQLKIMASPWTAPLWMKTNNSAIGGELKPEYYSVYAAYLQKYIESMAAIGIPVDALTIQNEPLHPGNNPSMYMNAEAQNTFIKNHLGPLFKRNNCKTKIMIYDHNLDRIDYPLSILDDPATNKYVDGTAFHLYGGSIEAMAYVHKKYPGKNLYFTEQMIDSRKVDLLNDLNWHVKNLIIGATRNWSKVVLQWNLATDASMGPHTLRPGCDICLGGVTIFPNDSIGRNPGYYIIGHASKFVTPGSKRIYSNSQNELLNVAFITPDKEKVLIVLNTQKKDQPFTIKYHNQQKLCALPPGAVGTFVWK
jgi:glucosylceramidase